MLSVQLMKLNIKNNNILTLVLSSYGKVKGKRHQDTIIKQKQRPEIRPLSLCPLVRAKGLEPIRLAAPDPKSGLATNYNTPAIMIVTPDGSAKIDIKT